MKTLNNLHLGKWITSFGHRGIGIRNVALILPCLLAGLISSQPSDAVPAPASATEALAIIINKANPVNNLTSEELRKHFSLEHERWPDGRKKTALMLPSGASERELVLRHIYHLNESEFTRHLLQVSFTGQALSVPKELASAVNMRKFVFNVPGAIGYVRTSQLDDTVKVIQIDGHSPGDADYPLKLSLK